MKKSYTGLLEDLTDSEIVWRKSPWCLYFTLNLHVHSQTKEKSQDIHVYTFTKFTTTSYPFGFF